MSTAVVVFTRDLRIHDHPALTAGRAADAVVPLFVLDPTILGHAGANRRAFLGESLADLDAGLRRRGGRLHLREGDTVDQVMRVVAETDAVSVHVSADVSRTAQRREARLREACRAERVAFEVHPGVTVVPPGEVTPAGGDHYKVFTPYFRAWSETSWRAEVPTPRRISVPENLDGVDLPQASDLAPSGTSPKRPPGGETEALTRLRRWAKTAAGAYDEAADLLDTDATSRLSPYLHFGCLSPHTAVRSASDAGAAGFVRQLAWRDFHHQVTRAFPDIGRRDYRPRGRRWKGDGPEFRTWREGRTGVALVDAAMAQLYAEGWVHNRARMVAASYLTKTLGVHWKLGADLYMEWLTDGDVANNYGNWQWMAGTGNDTRPNRELNPDRQAKRADPDGTYRARWLGARQR